MILNAQIYKTNNIVNLAIIDIGTTMYKFLPSGVFTIEPYSSGSLSGLNFSIKDNINIAALLQIVGGDKLIIPFC
uniref:hypothetical protein n=1 Tax=Escherichia coli TaxID=562 RepID=UPI0021CC7111|nr:hypothetical protein [Escherichia coli]